MSQKKFVMIGQNPMFGDYADLAHALGGRLSRVVVNVPDPPRENMKSFADRVAEYNKWLADDGDTAELEVVDIEDFVPDPEETALLGFRGRNSIPLRERMKSEFGLEFPALIHPTAYICGTAKIGEGTIVFSQAQVGSFFEIGAYGIVNHCASVGHDTICGDDVDISPNATLGSNIRIEDAVRVGLNSTVIESLTLGEYCYVAAGAAVIRDVPPAAIVAGVPAVVKKQRA